MTQLERLKLRLSSELAESDDSQDALLEELLLAAEQDILNKRYPFGTTITYLDENGNLQTKCAELEERYKGLQVELALVKYNMQGVEGQTSHAENGVTRAYKSYDALLSQVMPKAKALY